MLNFDEELEKFRPLMEVDDVEEALYHEDAAGAQGVPASEGVMPGTEDQVQQ